MIPGYGWLWKRFASLLTQSSSMVSLVVWSNSLVESSKVIPSCHICSSCVLKACSQCFEGLKQIGLLKELYLVSMEWTFLICSLPTIAYCFVKPRFKSVKCCSTYYHNMNRPLDKPLTIRKRWQDTKDSIKNLLGAKIMTDCKKYLGLLMVGGRTKTTTFREIQEHVTKRVLGWKEKFISNASHEILIKSIVQSILTYSMSLFRLPKAMCDAINSTLARYWWG